MKIKHVKSNQFIHCPTKAEFEAILELIRIEVYDGLPPVKFKKIFPDHWHQFAVNTIISSSKAQIFHICQVVTTEDIIPASKFLPETFYKMKAPEEAKKLRNILDLSERDVIICPTRREFNEILIMMSEQGIAHNLNSHGWEINKEKTYIRPSSGTFRNIEKAPKNFREYVASEFFARNESLKYADDYNSPKDMEMTEKTSSLIDSVTIERLSSVLTLLGIELPNETLDTIIDAVELIVEKGGSVTLDEIHKLKEDIKSYDASWEGWRVADGKGTLFGDFIFKNYGPQKFINEFQSEARQYRKGETAKAFFWDPFKPETIREELNKAANSDQHHNED